ncbi:MAG: MBL fold metallo-hydrolase [Planctomycetes bacterium]|nr:MBL fold metallo-hydrolase [Planctomycetota bacterium]
MNVEKVMDETFLANAYLVYDKPGGKGFFVDTAFDPGELIERAKELDLDVSHVICTHRHADHVAGSRLIKERLGSKVVAHELDASEIPTCDETVKEGDQLTIGGISLEILHIPGHTKGQIAIIAQKEYVFTGDTLFRGSIGGCVGPGHGTFEQLHHSIMERLMKLPLEWTVYPGHMEKTTVGEEWERNPFIRAFRGIDAPGNSICEAFGRAAELKVIARDYDGGKKAWIRFLDTNQDAVVPGSRIEKLEIRD